MSHPVNLINVENVGKSYGTVTVLDSVSLGVAAGERIGVVGRNGSGKSTLLRIIAGAEQPDTGRVTRTGGVLVVDVDQRGELPSGASIRDVVIGDAAEHEWAGDAAIREVLAGLGVAAVGLDADVDRLSGGERRRVALAAALVQQPQLLVLDEPTNHLDVEAITWLAAHLRTRRGALLVVTHDRWFLDEVCDHMWEVGDAAVRQFDGGYAAYVLARAERARQADASEARRQNLLRKELAWLRRGAPARTSKPRFRIDAAEALIADVPPPRSTVELRSLAQRRLGRTVVDLEDVTVNAGTRTLLDHVTWHVGPGDRVGIVGANGSGKTHLLRVLAGQLAPAAGSVRIGQTVHAGYLSQEVVELPDELRLIEAVREVKGTAVVDGTELSASQLAERFGFGNNRQQTRTRDLSGGERRRLQLLRVLLEQPNVLLLDEPTNDLDTDVLAALEDLLDSFAGTLVVVTHDRYLLERVCDTTMALLGDGTLRDLPGGVDQYLALRASASAAEPSARRERRGDARETRRELTRVERRIAALERREVELHAELAANATDFVKVAELDTALREAVAEREAAEEQWLELSE